MSESYDDGVCGDGAPDFIPPRAVRSGRRSGLGVSLVERDEAALLESMKAAPRRSSIIKGDIDKQDETKTDMTERIRPADRQRFIR